MSLKEGVRVLGIRPETVIAMQEAAAVCAEYAVPFMVTSVIDGTHKRASEHYSGCAFDMRRPDWPSFGNPTQAAAFTGALQARLGTDYDVVLEGDHLHVEFDPKVGY